LKAHARGNATSGDLISAVAAQSREPARVEAAFKSYIDQAGVPLLSVDVECRGGKAALALTQQRYLPIGSTANANQTWGIPLSVRYAAGGQVHEEKGIVTGTRARFELKDAQGCPTWVMPNGGGAGYFRFALAPRWQEALSSAFAALDEREQLVYADAITAAFDAGVLKPAQFLAALPQLVRSDSRQTVTAGNEKVRWIAEHLVEGPTRAAFLKSAADLYRPRLEQLGFTPKPDESDDDRLLRTTLVTFVADVLENESVRAEMVKAGRAVLGLDAEGALDADSVPTDLRGAALAMAVEEGGKDAFDLAEKHFRASRDPILRTELLAAMASSNDPALASRARGFVFEPDLLRRNEIFALIASQADEPALRAGMREWIDAHFKELDAKITPSTAGVVRAYTVGMCTAEDAAEAKSQFAERMNTIEGGPLALEQAVEQIRLCAAAKKARAKADISTFLTAASP
jgi:alanyl aminopeptidase